jgi:hypothetical protein
MLGIADTCFSRHPAVRITGPIVPAICQGEPVQARHSLRTSWLRRCQDEEAGTIGFVLRSTLSVAVLYAAGETKRFACTVPVHPLGRNQP